MSDLPKRPLASPPYKEAMLDEKGRLTNAWQRWFNEIFVRVGAKSALSNLQIEEELDDLDTRVSAFE
jgi:hypothetical protein